MRKEVKKEVRWRRENGRGGKLNEKVGTLRNEHKTWALQEWIQEQ